MSTQGTLPLDFSQCQRWRHGREHYRPAGELFDPRYASGQGRTLQLGLDWRF